jgi:hypothetical protein
VGGEHIEYTGRRAEEGSGGKKTAIRHAYENLLDSTAELISRERHAKTYTDYFFTRWWPRLMTLWSMTKFDHGDDAMNKRFEEMSEKLAGYRMINPLPNLGYVAGDANRIQDFYTLSLEARKLAEEYASLLDSKNKIY